MILKDFFYSKIRDQTGPFCTFYFILKSSNHDDLQQLGLLFSLGILVSSNNETDSVI